MADRCGSKTEDLFSNTHRALSHKENSVDTNGSDLSLGREKSVLLSQRLGNMESSLIRLNLQPNPASLGQIVEAPFSFARIAQGCCNQEFEIWWRKAPGWRESMECRSSQEVAPCL